jgi:hypothetical protein
MASLIHTTVKPNGGGNSKKRRKRRRGRGGGAYDKPVAESSLTLESIPNEWALPTIMHKVNLIISLNMRRSQGGEREREKVQ